MLVNNPTGFDDPQGQDVDSATWDRCKPLNILAQQGSEAGLVVVE